MVGCLFVQMPNRLSTTKGAIMEIIRFKTFKMIEDADYYDNTAFFYIPLIHIKRISFRDYEVVLVTEENIYFVPFTLSKQLKVKPDLLLGMLLNRFKLITLNDEIESPLFASELKLQKEFYIRDLELN